MNKFWAQNPLPPFPAKSVRKNGKIYLADDRDNCQPSITKILNRTKPPAEKARLNNWRQKVGETEANRIISTSLQRGKIGHSFIESFFKGQSQTCPKIIEPHWKNLLPFIQQINSIRLLEGNVFHHYEGYAGRVDCVGCFNDLPECVIDFKFSDRPKPIYEDQILPLAAYIGALNRQYGHPYKVKIKEALLIVATPEGVDATLFDANQVKEYWRKWQQRVAQFWEVKRAIAQATRCTDVGIVGKSAFRRPEL